MRRAVVPGIILALSLVPSLALATTIDASLVPDGTYTVKVEQVVDAKHALVKMDNGEETTLTAAGTVDFSKVKPNATIKCSIIKGKVPVYAVM